jgi:hypothetical protein
VNVPDPRPYIMTFNLLLFKYILFDIIYKDYRFDSLFFDLQKDTFLEDFVMGRKPVDEREKRIRVSISLKRKYVEELKKRNVNISRLVEDFVKKFLKMD